MAKLNTLPKLSVIAVLLTGIVGCGSDSESADLVKAVTLEKLRTEGTIIESVTIENDQTRLRAGEKHQLSATGLDSNGETRNVTNELTWTSSNTDIATVSNSGLVTAVANLSANQGIITITGTTINDISGEGEMSISDEAVTSIQLKQASPETGNINTCINANINGDVTYADGYISLSTVKDMSFVLDDTTTASIDSDGTLYTSAAEIENTSITAKINDITDQLIVTADPVNLENIDVLVNGDSTDIITLNVGSRLQVNAQASLVNDESAFDINSTISWSVPNTNNVGITTEDSENVTLFALKPGVTQLIGTCGGKQQVVAVEVTGSATLDSIQINDGESPLVLEPLQTIDLTLTANYSTSPSSLNVTEFADWSLNGSDIVSAEIIDPGTNQALYRITSTSSANGTAIVSVTYDGIISSTQINIE
ncbi:Ig-like domain-containing protein [Pseudoalteromonas sp. SWXJZ94C]|uniref:Ig-like domain-containing protein n=1 Tax=unclassified Pseudoalteromonas TaxID=194690 RepID=UPI00140E94A1|nr:MULTISPECIES: Ig-like domain-containing protein [unclassified Pseudoalteromonas]MBH0058770.1 Ig-like domain-containing protein [Pseudoalteromonas sp. SWXJZ94C]